MTTRRIYNFTGKPLAIVGHSYRNGEHIEVDMLQAIEVHGTIEVTIDHTPTRPNEYVSPTDDAPSWAIRTRARTIDVRPRVGVVEDSIIIAPREAMVAHHSIAASHYPTCEIVYPDLTGRTAQVDGRTVALASGLERLF